MVPPPPRNKNVATLQLVFATHSMNAYFFQKERRKHSAKGSVGREQMRVDLNEEEVKQQLEQLEQKITFTLRMIDSSLVDAQHAASGILSKVCT